MKIWQVYWRGEDRQSYHGYVKADSNNEAYGIVQSKLRRGFQVTAIYEATENQITPQSLTINFANTATYNLF